MKSIREGALNMAKEIKARELKTLREAVFADVCEKRGYHIFEQDFLSDDPPICECGVSPKKYKPRKR